MVYRIDLNWATLSVVVVVGVLDSVQKYYIINDKEASLVSTSFIVGYMLLSPIFGYLGDRINRTVMMSCGIIGWSLITFGSSFVGQQVQTLFILTSFLCLCYH